MHLKNLNYKHSRFLSKIYYRNRIVLNLNKSPAVVIPPEPPSQRKGAAKAGAVQGEHSEREKRPALDGIASQERRNKRQEGEGDDKEFPLVDLSKTPELPIWHKSDVLLGVPPPCGQRCTSCLLGQFVLAGPPPCGQRCTPSQVNDALHHQPPRWQRQVGQQRDM